MLSGHPQRERDEDTTGSRIGVVTLTVGERDETPLAQTITLLTTADEVIERGHTYWTTPGARVGR